MAERDLEDETKGKGKAKMVVDAQNPDQNLPPNLQKNEAHRLLARKTGKPAETTLWEPALVEPIVISGTPVCRDWRNGTCADDKKCAFLHQEKPVKPGNATPGDSRLGG